MNTFSVCNKLFHRLSLLGMAIFNCTFVTATTISVGSRALPKAAMTRANYFNRVISTLINHATVIILISMFLPRPFNEIFRCLTNSCPVADVATSLTPFAGQMSVWSLFELPMHIANNGYWCTTVYIYHLIVAILVAVDGSRSLDKFLLCQFLGHISVCLVIGTKNGAGYVC